VSTAISWKWVWMTGLIAAAVASYGILIRSPDEEVVASEKPAQPGHYLKDAILTITLPDGRERLTLVAERIDEQVNDKSYAAQGVHMDYTAIPGRPWSLRANAAAVPATLETVELSGDVEVRGEQAEQAGIIRTQSLTLDTKGNVAYTAAPVEIEFAGHRLNATGLRADLNTEVLQLQSEVNGRFE
jgi:LPS export ABC transporter protein LptC